MITGLAVLAVTDEGFVSTTSPSIPLTRARSRPRSPRARRGEARRAGFDSLYLYTHETMTENQSLYSRIGYVEYDRRPAGDACLVYMRKPLSGNVFAPGAVPRPTSDPVLTPPARGR